MKIEIKTEILPLRGLPLINFGDTIEDVESILGKPEETLMLEDIEERTLPAMVYLYWNSCLTFFFSTLEEKPFLIMIETDDLNAQLLDEKIFKMKPKQFIALLSGQKLFDFEKEQERHEIRYTWDEWNIDFYFDGDKLSTVNWSAQLDDTGHVVIPEEPFKW